MIKKTIGNATLYCADCKDVLPLLKEIDACVTDPPYGLSFMGKAWDYDVPGVDIWSEVLCALKPGAHLVSFFGSRTYHRGAIPIEDAGFEIRDQLMWLYGSGFPKSHNIGKAVDKLQGNKRIKINDKDKARRNKNTSKFSNAYGDIIDKNDFVTKGFSKYEGWGTALKPAHEPIVMARKPFKGTVANNVLEHGTGGINIDECRVGDETIINRPAGNKGGGNSYNLSVKGMPQDASHTTSNGRFPANLMHDGSKTVEKVFGDKSRFFYCAKASKKDRDEQNTHPTVKPTELMRYLCRLVTPKGGLIVDPFMGSGSTGKAALVEGFEFIGIEMNENYFDIACARIKEAQTKNGFF